MAGAMNTEAAFRTLRRLVRSFVFIFLFLPRDDPDVAVVDRVAVMLNENGAGLGRDLPDRLRRQAWLLAQLYEDKEESLWALAAAVALEEGVIIEHPLLREMMDVSFLNAVGHW